MAGAGPFGPPVFLCAGDGCRDEIVSIELERFAALAAAGTEKGAGMGLATGTELAGAWAELRALAAGRIGGRLELDAAGRCELLRLLAPSGAVTTEAGGTATRIAIGLAGQDQRTQLACFEGSAGLAGLLPDGLSVTDLHPHGDPPVHLIVEIADGTGGVGHPSEALGRLSIEPPARPVDGEGVVAGINSLVAALPPDIDVMVVYSAVPLAVVERSSAELARSRERMRFYVELGEDMRAVGGPAGGGTDRMALHRLGPAVTVSMNEPTWIGLTGSGDVSDPALASALEDWGCGAIVVHRERDATVITADESRADLACLRRGVAMATLFAERGVLPGCAAVEERMQVISGTSTTWGPEEGTGRIVRRSRVEVPVCRRPVRTVGLGDAFAAGFLTQMGSGSAVRPEVPAASCH